MSLYAVVCRTCQHNVYEGDTSPDDGQVLLTQYAESTPGAKCPSGHTDCPNKTAAVNSSKQQAIPALLARIAALEAKVNAKP